VKRHEREWCIKHWEIFSSVSGENFRPLLSYWISQGLVRQQCKPTYSTVGRLCIIVFLWLLPDFGDRYGPGSMIYPRSHLIPVLILTLYWSAFSSGFQLRRCTPHTQVRSSCRTFIIVQNLTIYRIHFNEPWLFSTYKSGGSQTLDSRSPKAGLWLRIFISRYWSCGRPCPSGWKKK